MYVWKWCHYTMVEAVEPFTLHPTASMSCIYRVFEHLWLMWMGIWLHIHTCTTTDVCPVLVELAKILGDVSVVVETAVPLCNGWECRTFQTASHIHLIHIHGVWAPYIVVDWHMAPPSHRYHTSVDMGERWQKPRWLVNKYGATMLWLRL